jgi:hypothetical protein
MGDAHVMGLEGRDFPADDCGCLLSPDSHKLVSQIVIPAEAGIHSFQDLLDSRFRGNDKKGRFSKPSE